MSGNEDGYGGSVLGGPVAVADFGVDPHSVPVDMRHEGPDWFAIFNPGASKEKKRTLDVELVHTLMHERYAALHSYLLSRWY